MGTGNHVDEVMKGLMRVGNAHNKEHPGLVSAIMLASTGVYRIEKIFDASCCRITAINVETGESVVIGDGPVWPMIRCTSYARESGYIVGKTNRADPGVVCYYRDEGGDE